MSDNLELEAREQQKKAGFLAQPQDLYACQHEHGCAAFLVDDVTGYFDGQPCDCGANSRWGDLASKRMRANEQEIVTLRARVEGLEKIASLADSIAHEFEVAVESRNPVCGMSVPPSGDFISCARLPSAVGRMRWWAREIRKAQPITVPEAKDNAPQQGV